MNIKLFNSCEYIANRNTETLPYSLMEEIERFSSWHFIDFSNSNPNAQDCITGIAKRADQYSKFFQVWRLRHRVDEGWFGYE